MKALITGGAGFIGSHLADELLARGYQLILLDDLSTGRHSNIEHLLGRQDVEFVLGSILNADLVDDVMARADVCFHLAAAVGVNLIVERPLQSLMTNIRGSEIVFEKAHTHGTRTLVTQGSREHTHPRPPLQSGQLFTVGRLAIDLGDGPLSFDAKDPRLALLCVSRGARSELYRVDLRTAAVESLGRIALDEPVTAIAMAPRPRGAGTTTTKTTAAATAAGTR